MAGKSLRISRKLAVESDTLHNSRRPTVIRGDHTCATSADVVTQAIEIAPQKQIDFLLENN